MGKKIHQIFHATSCWRLGCLALASVLCWLASAVVNTANATVYRWEDAQGVTHYSEVVHEQYRSVAQPVDVTATDPTAQQRQDAVERAQKDKAKADAI